MSEIDLHPFTGSTLENEGIHTEKIIELEKQFSKFNVETFTIWRNGVIAHTFEQKTGLLREKHRLNSVTKSFLSSLIGIAIYEGKISSINQPVSDFFQQTKGVSTELQRINLKQLLTMTSGFQPRDWNRITESSHWMNTILSLSLQHSPGKMMTYNNIDSHLLSAIIHQATGSSASEYLQENILIPLDIHKISWEKDPGDIAIGGYGIHLSPLDLLKYGILILQNGVWNNQQIIPSSWVGEATSEKVNTDKWKQHYGYHWWISEKIAKKQPSFFYAAGRGGKFLFIYPEKNLIAVFSGSLSSKDSLLPYQWFVKYVLSSIK